MAKADVLIAVSKSTRGDLIRRLPSVADRVRIVHLPLRAPLAGTLPDDVPRPYLLHVGNGAFYKNRDGLLRIFARISLQFAGDLVLVGPVLNSTQRDYVRGQGLAERVHQLDGLDEATLGALYRDAELLLFPSLYEGYGWPPLEAMALGCPVVCSQRASLPELVGDAAVLCDPGDEAEFAAVALNVLAQPEQRDRLRACGPSQAQQFTLESMSTAVSTAYADACAHHQEQ